MFQDFLRQPTDAAMKRVFRKKRVEPDDKGAQVQ